jgi:benzoate/toluate 1,2-dioxygenase subunit beta
MSEAVITPAIASRRALSIEDVTQYLYREARFLDDKEWDSWLALYHPDVEFWMPSWDDDDKLVENPQAEVSLIWYGHKGGLEDRVFRIRTERSSATSLPEPRTSHNISNVEILFQGDCECRLRFNWITLSFRYKTIDTYFGTSFYTLDTSGAKPLIRNKKIILKNDYIHHVVDIYQI